MNNLLLSILGGEVIIIAAFFILSFIKRLSGKYAATMTALLTLLVYVPMSILSWPGGDVFAMHIAIYLVTSYILGIISSYREARIAEGGSGKVGFHWGPAAIIAFFVVFISLDSIFVSAATQGVGNDWMHRLFPNHRPGVKVGSYFPGTVANDYQKEQEKYNSYLQQMDSQDSRGWQLKKGWQHDPVAQQANTFMLQLQDKDGKPLDHAIVKARFLHPSNAEHDILFQMEEKQPGLYAMDLTMPHAGRWDLFMQIWVGDQYYESQSHTIVSTAP